MSNKNFIDSPAKIMGNPNKAMSTAPPSGSNTTSDNGSSAASAQSRSGLRGSGKIPGVTFQSMPASRMGGVKISGGKGKK